jgi:hypothetical protein
MSCEQGARAEGHTTHSSFCLSRVTSSRHLLWPSRLGYSIPYAPTALQASTVMFTTDTCNSLTISLSV